MRWSYRVAVAILSFVAAYVPARAEDPKATAILDKAITALGGEDNLNKITAFKWAGTVAFHGAGGGRPYDVEFTVDGLGRMRRKWGLNLTVVAGDKGWQKRGDVVRDMRDEAIAREKRSIYLQVIPVTLVQLKGKDYRCEAAGEEKVGDKLAAKVKVSAPDGKDFTLLFDIETGLPVKEVAQVWAPNGQDVTTETTFADYKDFGGIKKATKIEITSSGFGGGSSQVINDFKVLETVPDDTFAAPK
jgi:hypothetical protein